MAYRDEIARLEAMHAANPDGRVFAHLAEAYRKAGEFERARQVLQAGLERHPQYASAHVVLGRVLLDLSERASADASFRRVLELDPHNMVALRARADIAHEQGDDHAALRFYRELITLDPSDEQAVLRIAEIESRPPGAAKPDAHGPAAQEAVEPAEPGWGDVEPTPHAPEEETIEAAPPSAYGEAALPEVAASEPAASAQPFVPAEFGEVSIDSPPPAPAAAGDVDLGLGGLLEPTDVAASARTEEMADAAVDLSGMGGAFAMPPEPAPAEDLSLPGLDELAVDATPAPAEPAPEPIAPPSPARGDLDVLPGPILGTPRPSEREPAPLPTAPAAEPAPAPAAAVGEPDVVDTPAEVHALWTTYDDGAAAALPDIGPELVTETIGDLYAQQGLHERAADVYARLLASRPGDANLESKLQRARAAAASGASTPAVTPAPMPLPKPVEVAPLGAFAAPGPTPPAPEPAPVAERTPLTPEPVSTFPDGELPQGETPAAPEAGAFEPESARAGDVLEVETSAAGSAPEPTPIPPFEPVAEEPAGPMPAYTSSLPWEETALPVPEAPGAREAEPFGLPSFGDVGADLPFDLPTLAPVEEDAFGLPPIPETPTPALADAALQEPVVPIEELGFAAVGAVDVPEPPAAPAPRPEPKQPAPFESVESAWTGGAGTASDTASPFGWAEPETAATQATIGEYFDRLLAEAPAIEAAPAPAAAEMPAPAIEAAPAPVAAEMPAPAMPAPQASASFDDIDALFSDVPDTSARAPEPEVPAAGAPGYDDFDALFGAPAAAAPIPDAALDTSTPAAAPPMEPPAMPEPVAAASAEPQASPAPAAEAGFAWDPFAELTPEASTPATPAGAAGASAGATSAGSDAAGVSAGAAGSAGGFEWDPFAELAEEAAAPAPAGTPEPAAVEGDAADDDDEDIDMFRAWLQSLKR